MLPDLFKSEHVATFQALHLIEQFITKNYSCRESGIGNFIAFSNAEIFLTVCRRTIKSLYCSRIKTRSVPRRLYLTTISRTHLPYITDISYTRVYGNVSMN